MPALITDPHHERHITRRSTILGSAASLLCAPAVVRAASLMPKQPTAMQWSAEEQSIIDFWSGEKIVR